MAVIEQGVTIVTDNPTEGEKIRAAMIRAGMVVEDVSTTVNISIHPFTMREMIVLPSNRPDRNQKRDWRRDQKRLNKLACK